MPASPPSPAPGDQPPVALPDAAALAEALGDARVAKALRLALRDVELRRRFEALRQSGRTVEAAVADLLGPYEDDQGRPYFLSEERVRGVVYRKRSRSADPARS